MRKFFYLTVFLIHLKGVCYSQWSNIADNATTGSLSIGSVSDNSYSSFTINGPNFPFGAGSKRDIVFNFSSAGKSYIRSYRGGSWDTYLQFLTTASDNTNGVRVHIDGVGNMGIGTTSPSTLLHIFQGNSSLTKSSYSRAVIESNDHSQVDILSGANKESGIYLQSTGGSGRTYGGIAYYNEGTSTYGLSLYSGNAIRARILENGNIGIGTTSPAAKLDVGAFISGGTLGTVFGRLQEGNSSGAGTFLGVRGYDTQPTNAKSFAIEHSFYGNVNSSINFNRGGGTTGGFITFNTDANTEQVRITNTGYVGIGTPSPDAKLAVNGQVHATEVRVTTSVPGPDYVFEKDYKLTPLEEIKNYIDQNKHLPEVPSAKEMEKNGVQLGEMNMLLLKKIEELTLHTIALNEKMEKVTMENQEMRSEIKQLKKD